MHKDLESGHTHMHTHPPTHPHPVTHPPPHPPTPTPTPTHRVYLHTVLELTELRSERLNLCLQPGPQVGMLLARDQREGELGYVALNAQPMLQMCMEVQVYSTLHS